MAKPIQLQLQWNEFAQLMKRWSNTNLGDQWAIRRRIELDADESGRMRRRCFEIGYNINVIINIDHQRARVRAHASWLEQTRTQSAAANIPKDIDLVYEAPEKILPDRAHMHVHALATAVH